MRMDLDRLVESARRNPVRPTPTQRAGVKRGAIAVATLGAASVSAMSVAKLVLTGAVAAAVGAAATVQVLHAVAPRTERHPPIVAPSNQLRAPRPESNSSPPPPPPTELPAEAPQPLAERLPSEPSKAPPPAPPLASPSSPDLPMPSTFSRPMPREPSTPHPSALAVELNLVGRAAEAIDAHDFAAAEKALDEYDARVRNGALTSEAGVLRVLIECASGKSDHALDIATALVRRDAANPLLQRLRTTCAAGALTSLPKP